METIKLTGHSGCALKVEKRGDTYVVVKTAKDKAYSARLERQAQKQSDFLHDTFSAPRVLHTNHTKDGLFEFAMEYINGFTLAEHLKNISAAHIPMLVEQFMSLIPKNNTPDPRALSLHRTKIAELKSKIPQDGPVAQMHELLMHYPWEHSVASYCHGDLTLENVIWKDGKLYLIDFLDSYYDSWMQDFGKLLFDLETGWSYRTDTIDKNLLTRISIFKDTLLRQLYALPNGSNMVKEIYHLALLHAVRVAPYTHDSRVMAHLEAGVRKLRNVIDSL